MFGIIGLVILFAKNVLVYLGLRFRRLSCWIVATAAASYWPAVSENGGVHGDPLRESSVKWGLHLPTMWMKESRNH